MEECFFDISTILDIDNECDENEDERTSDIKNAPEDEQNIIIEKPLYNIDTFPDYFEILKLDPINLINFLESGESYKLTPIDTPFAAEDAMNMLGRISQRINYLESLNSRARVVKRQLQRTGCGPKDEAYSDMIDNEKSIEAALSSLDKIYKTISKAVSLFQCELTHGAIA